jgi:hypothetical protein
MKKLALIGYVAVVVGLAALVSANGHRSAAEKQNLGARTTSQ